MRSEYEQDDERDDQAEQTRRFGEREAEEQVRELARSGRRVAQGAREIAAEDIADAEPGADESRRRDPCADELCCCCFHVKSPWIDWMFECEFSDAYEAHR
jgi:hypothetical protein